MVQILVGYMGLSALKLLRIVFGLWLLQQLEVLFLLDDFELSSLLIEHELLSREHDSLARLHGLTVEDVCRQLDRVNISLHLLSQRFLILLSHLLV